MVRWPCIYFDGTVAGCQVRQNAARLQQQQLRGRVGGANARTHARIMRRRCAQRCRNHRHTRSGRASFTCQSANQYRVNYAAVYSRQYAVIVFMHFTQRYILIACTNIISCDDHYTAILPRWGGAWGWGCALPRNFFLNFLNENGVHSGALFFKFKCLQEKVSSYFFCIHRDDLLQSDDYCTVVGSRHNSLVAYPPLCQQHMSTTVNKYASVYRSPPQQQQTLYRCH